MDETIKAGLLDLVEHAVEQGWSARRAAELLGLDHVRCGRWQARRASGELADRAPGGHPLHGLLEHERAAILALFEAWGHIDRSHRKLAHRGSRLGLVHVEGGVWAGAGGDVGDVGSEVVEVEVGVDGDGAVVADDGEWSAGGGPGADEVVGCGGGLGGGDGFEFVGG